MNERFSRFTKLIGEEALSALSQKRVIVFGLGGVGGSAAEALARSGIGALDLVDKDTFEESNLNRQLFATEATLGLLKTDAAASRLFSINPSLHIKKHPLFYLPETADVFDLHEYDFVLDCIDNVTAKLCLIERALAAGTPIISSMGAGNRMDPSRLQVEDLAKTSIDPLAKVMRQELRKRGIEHLPVVYSTETPVKTGSSTPGSSAFVPPAAGLLMASYAIRSMLGQPL